MKYFTCFLNEAKDMLDISLKEIGKVFNTTSKIQKLLNTKVTIYEKYDGTKLSLIRNSEKFDAKNYQNNWIVAYKNNIIYPTEFSGVNSKQIKSKSIGTSQYKLVHDHLRRVHKNTGSIPTNTEFFIEYLMDKPTLTRDYKFKHGMVLLAYSPTRIKVNNGIVKTNSPKFNTTKRSKFAETLKINEPKLIYKGTLGNYIKGNFDTPEEHLESIRQNILKIQSEFGGKTEGVVIEMPNGDLYKFLQDDQHDVKTRDAKKAKYKMDRNSENQYWKDVRETVLPLVNSVNKGNLETALSDLSKTIYSMKTIPVKHSKKIGIQIQDDMFLTAKSILIKKLKGNNGALFVGRFSPPTKAHMKIVEDALKKYDTVTLNIVKSGKINAENPFPIDLQIKIWKSVFPKLIIQTTTTGNLITILNKADNNINVVLAGSDRKDTYKQQLARSPDISVEEIKRTAQDISATKVREALQKNDFNTFKTQMDRRAWVFYDELRKYIE